jgi:ubiquinone/menaquinone biosynthesis C-methylase UbiE
VPTTNVLEEERERQRHDELYTTERRTMRLQPADWQRFDNPRNAANPYIASIRKLGDVRGRVVLDAGCGTGWLSVIVAKRGAKRVDGFDISPAAIAVARELAMANDCLHACRFVEGSFYDIPASDASYDLVVGQAIIHHVQEKPRIAAELARVMKPGGRAVFYEPMSNARWLERIRLLVPLARGSDDPDEWQHKIRYDDLTPFKEHFEVRWEEFEMLQWMARLAPSSRRFLERVDVRLLDAVPWLRRYARGIVIEFTKPTHTIRSVPLDAAPCP